MTRNPNPVLILQHILVAHAMNSFCRSSSSNLFNVSKLFKKIIFISEISLLISYFYSVWRFIFGKLGYLFLFLLTFTQVDVTTSLDTFKIFIIHFFPLLYVDTIRSFRLNQSHLIAIPVQSLYAVPCLYLNGGIEL